MVGKRFVHFLQTSAPAGAETEDEQQVQGQESKRGESKDA